MTSSAPADLLDLERDLPTTPEDVRALRRLRFRPGENLLPRLDELTPPDLFGSPPRRRPTSEGWEPFEL